MKLHANRRNHVQIEENDRVFDIQSLENSF